MFSARLPGAASKEGAYDLQQKKRGLRPLFPVCPAPSAGPAQRRGGRRAVKSRLQRLVLLTGLVLLGVAAGVALSRAGVGVPCLFHAATGLDCPGCGATRMLSALAAGDLAAAWRSNPALLLLCPLLALLAVRLAAGWARTGTLRPSPVQTFLLWACAAVLLVFGVLRNLPFYPY
ncbi:DUF2752 domain-containing protein [Anaerofilum sp. BX8]|uniref:DUF2752 domain-containing protein n=1 Tax=Anaerofilum hominis TaxID=2763016 RepID=A0A923RHG8_9FIRM|nr:DUF2752 domain-containing protein [Anaerofilum hominis]